MSTLTYAGSETIGELTPLVVSATAEATAKLQADFGGAVSLEASLNVTPPTVAATAAACAAFIANIDAAAALGLPSVSFDLAACATLKAHLQASLSVLATLSALFGAAGIYAWTFEGTGPELGPALAAELVTGWPDGNPPSLPANAVVLATVAPATWTAMRAFFGGLP